MGLLHGAPVMLLTAQVPRCDREEVLLCLIRIVLGLQSQERNGHWLLTQNTLKTKGAQDSLQVALQGHASVDPAGLDMARERLMDWPSLLAILCPYRGLNRACIR